MTAWYSVTTPEEEERLTSAWGDAPIENVELVSMLLDIAHQQVMAFAAADDAPDAQVYDLLSGLGYDDATIAAVLDALGLLDPETDPEEPLVVEPPDRYVYAQLQQAQNLWNAGRSSVEGGVGTEGYTFQPRPLDKTIRAIIRPTSGGADVY